MVGRDEVIEEGFGLGFSAREEEDGGGGGFCWREEERGVSLSGVSCLGSKVAREGETAIKEAESCRQQGGFFTGIGLCPFLVFVCIDLKIGSGKQGFRPNDKS